MPVKHKRRRNKVKDPLAPKRPRSAYILFCSDRREEAKARAPEAGATEILKRLGEMWQELTPEQKLPWVEKAETDKQRYKSESSVYVPPNHPVHHKSGRRIKDPLAPKRARSAYIFFASGARQEVKGELPDISNTDLLREMGARWNKMSDEAKAPYEEQASQDRERYKRESAAYTQHLVQRQQQAQAEVALRMQQANRVLQQQQQQQQLQAASAMNPLHEDQYPHQLEAADYRPPPPPPPHHQHQQHHPHQQYHHF